MKSASFSCLLLDRRLAKLSTHDICVSGGKRLRSEVCVKTHRESRIGPRFESRPGTLVGLFAREYMDWRWPFSSVHSIKMVFSAQVAEGGVAPHPLHYIYPPPQKLHRPLHPLPSKTNETQLPVLSHIAPLPFLSGAFEP